MIRHLLLASLFLLCAGLMLACDKPAEVARRELDRIQRTAHQTDESFQRTTTRALLTVATTERGKREADLKAAGCALDAASQPAPCAAIVATHRAAYEAQRDKLVAAAGKVNAGIGALYAALLVAVDLVIDLEAGVATLPALQAGVVQLGTLLADVLAAYRAFRLAFGGTP
jgi:hypothetical protein